MRSEDVTFYSGGHKLTARFHTPDTGDIPFRSLVQGPGWMGLGDAAAYRPYHEAFTEAGFGVLSINYRGFGGGGGQPSITTQVDDLISAVSYLRRRDDVESDAIGAFATGGTGGGNVVSLAARDDRVRCVISQFPVADGGSWLRRMRSEHEWLSLLEEIEEDRLVRAVSGKGRLVDPTAIMIPTPERQETGFKADVADRVPTQIPLAIADELLSYRPGAEARGLRTPMMLIGVEHDTTTPIEHARDIYDVLCGPRELLIQRGVGHYGAYTRYGSRVTEQIISFLRHHLRPRGELMVERSEEPQ